jgi:hypothetical protein
MSCDAVAFSAMLWMASFNPGQGASLTPAVMQAPAAPASVAGEPLFIDIVKRARQLKVQTEAYRAQLTKADPSGPAATLKALDAFSGEIGDLAALDMKGHVTLKERGAVDDLKCILRGISQDLPEKLAAVRAATTIKAQDLALRDMVYLLNDNVEVITAPPRPAA